MDVLVSEPWKGDRRKVNVEVKKLKLGTSLMVQWLRTHLAMQGMQAGSLVWEPRSHMPQSNKPVRHNP